MFYFYLDGSVCAVDVNSNEYLVAARDLREGSWTVSQDQSRLAWQDGGEAYGAEVIHVLNLETGSSRDITAPDGQLVQVLGFVEEDFIYGTAAKEDLWMEGSRVIGLPAYRLQIVDSDLQVQADYEKEGIRIFRVEVADGRIHLDQMVRSGDGYEKADEDIIVCNTEVRADGQELVGWYASDDRKRVYFIQLETEAAAGLQRIAPESVTYDLSNTLEIDWGGRAGEGFLQRLRKRASPGSPGEPGGGHRPELRRHGVCDGWRRAHCLGSGGPAEYAEHPGLGAGGREADPLPGGFLGGRGVPGRDAGDGRQGSYPSPDALLCGEGLPGGSLRAGRQLPSDHRL